MSARFRYLLPVLCLVGLPVGAAQQCVVIGDSLTKEYEVEFPALFPQNPASWDSRNWIEILHERRNAWFDTGRFSVYEPPRFTGHNHNWAFPGATSKEINSQLKTFGQFMAIKDHIKETAERVVIFAGGNDVDSYYGKIYNGTSPTAYIKETRESIEGIVNYVWGLKSSLPIVLVSVPHLGCAPDVQAQCPTDSVKTARVTAALDTLNSQLATFAQSKGIGFVPGVYQLTKDMITQPFTIGGVEFYRQADADARPRYVFSGDGFHPNTCAHAKIAQMVIEAFRSKYPATQITPLTDNEILVNILDVDPGPVAPSPAFTDWIATQGVPADQSGPEDDPDGDGLTNGVEFALEGGAASAPNSSLLQPRVEVGVVPKQLAWSYKIRAGVTGWGTILPQQSVDLKNWSNVAAGSITTSADGTQTVRLPVTGGRRFLRLGVDF